MRGFRTKRIYTEGIGQSVRYNKGSKIKIFAYVLYGRPITMLSLSVKVP